MSVARRPFNAPAREAATVALLAALACQAITAGRADDAYGLARAAAHAALTIRRSQRWWRRLRWFPRLQ